MFMNYLTHIYTFAYHSNEYSARNTPVAVDIDRKTRLRQRGATTRNEGRGAHSGMRFFATLVGTARALERARPAETIFAYVISPLP